MKTLYVFETRLMAEWAADCLTENAKEILVKYGRITVADIFDIMEKITLDPIFKSSLTYVSNMYGWSKVDDLNIRVYRERFWGYSTYGIELSDPKGLS